MDFQLPIMTRHWINGKKVTRAEFPSIQDMLKLAMAHKPFGDGYNMNEYARSHLNADVYGASMADWRTQEISDIKACLSGNCPKHILAAVQKIKDEIEAFVEPPVQSRRKRVHFQEEGDELDPVAWIQRRADGWDDTVQTYKPRPIIRIGIDQTISGAEKWRTLAARGGAAAALADIYTSMGHSVEVIAFTSVGNLPELGQIISSIQCKSPDAPMDLGLLTYTTASTAFWRAVALIATWRLCKNGVSMGLGPILPVPKEFREELDFFIPTAVRPENVVEWVKEKLRLKMGAQS